MDDISKEWPTHSSPPKNNIITHLFRFLSTEANIEQDNNYLDLFLRRLVRGLQRDVVYLGWPIAPSHVSPNAGDGGRVLRGLSQWVQLCTWGPNKLQRFNSKFNLWVNQLGLYKCFIGKRRLMWMCISVKLLTDPWEWWAFIGRVRRT